MTTLRAKHETVTPCLRRIPLSQEKYPAFPRRPLPGEWPESFSAAHCSQRSSSVMGCRLHPGAGHRMHRRLNARHPDVWRTTREVEQR
jgi:hypothetical protein